MITVRYFAGLKEITGTEQDYLPITSMTVGELIEWASNTYDGFSNAAHSILVAINEEYVQRNKEIQSGDIVAFIPPVSGG
ncbi:MAG TPA: molybdopterin converting factor subunit 1 [Candidatus Paenibacillus intestinavium]|nr:molybdopterin converting factor subunit 1 [Candidatus Paenibacillus intestinavium]